MPIPNKHNTIRDKMNAIMEIVSVPTSRNKTKLDIARLFLSKKKKIDLTNSLRSSVHFQRKLPLILKEIILVTVSLSLLTLHWKVV
jgi:hypothetical protein